MTRMTTQNARRNVAGYLNNLRAMRVRVGVCVKGFEKTRPHAVLRFPVSGPMTRSSRSSRTSSSSTDVIFLPIRARAREAIGRGGRGVLIQPQCARADFLYSPLRACASGGIGRPCTRSRDEHPCKPISTQGEDMSTCKLTSGESHDSVGVAPVPAGIRSEPSVWMGLHPFGGRAT